MKRWVGLMICLLAAGCDYTVPLAKAPAMDIDRRLVGLWERTQADNKLEQILVLPLGAREYLVSFHPADPDGIFAKGCLVKCAGKLLVQLEWFGTARGKTPDDPRVYQFAAYTVKGDELTVDLLNAAAIGRDFKATDELVAAIEANRDNAELFREPMVFTKVNK